MKPEAEFMSSPEPADNQGFMRLNWHKPGDPSRPLLVFAPPESDVSPEFVNALPALGFEFVVWQLDPAATRHSRKRREELARLRDLYANAAPGWVGVLPFDLKLARLAEKAFPDATVVLLADDPVALWVNAEADHPTVRHAILSTAQAIADLAAFAATTRLDLMTVSLRKAKEHPHLVLRALCEFRGVQPAAGAFEAAVAVLGRLQSDAVQRPIQRALTGNAVRGGVDLIHKHGVVTGWVKQAMSGDRLEVRVEVNGEEVGRTTAEELRQDLAQSGIGDGCHGFKIDITAHLTTDTARVEVFEVASGLRIGEINMTVDRGKRVTASSAPLKEAAA